MIADRDGDTVDDDSIHPLPVQPSRFAALMFLIGEQDMVASSKPNALGKSGHSIGGTAGKKDFIVRAADEASGFRPHSVGGADDALLIGPVRHHHGVGLDLAPSGGGASKNIIGRRAGGCRVEVDHARCKSEFVAPH